MGLLDAFSADPGSAQAMQLQGLLGGLTRMGGLLAQAGQFRPVGQAAPGIGDAFLGFGEGQKAATANAYQNAQMARKAAQQALIAEAQSQKPDTDLSPQAAAMRRALSGMPEDVRALAGPDELPGLAVDRAKNRQRPMTAAELAQAGFRPGTAAFTSDWTGGANVAQQPDVMTPEAMAQKIAIQRAGLQAPAPIVLGPGQVAFTRDGRQIAAGAPDGQPLSPANAWNDVLRYAPGVAEGKIDANSPEGRRYLAAQSILTQPQPMPVQKEDGTTVMMMREPNFPFPKLQPTAGAGGAAGGAASGAGTVVKQPAPLTEAQGNATMFLNRMQEAEKRLQDVQAKGYVPGNLSDTMAGKAGMAGNYVMSAPAQQYKQAASDWITAVLRKESGAVISEQEFARYAPMFFPQPGDSAEVVKQKAEARRTAMDGLKQATGHGASRLESAQPPPAPSTTAPALRWNPATGKVEPVR